MPPVSTAPAAIERPATLPLIAIDFTLSAPVTESPMFSPTEAAIFQPLIDGDDNSGDNILYTSPSINGWTIAASVGENTSNADRVKSIAIKGKVAGLSIAAGAVDTGTAFDDTFVTLGYKVAGVSLGYGSYDSDEDTSTAISIKTNVAGMTVGFRHDDLDADTDNNMNTYSIGKDFGGMSMTLMYEDQDLADNSEWNLQYAMGF